MLLLGLWKKDKSNLVSIDGKIQDVLGIDSKRKLIIQRKIFRITPRNLPLLFQRLSLTWKELIYFSKPEDNFAFIAIGKINAPSVDNNSIIIDQEDQSFLEIIPPLFVGYQKFTDEKFTALWGDFKSKEWYLPKFLLLRKGENFSFIKNILVGDEPDFLDQLKSLNQTTINIINEFGDNSLPNSGLTEWSNHLQNYLYSIKNNIVEKVVLARQVVAELKNFSSEFSLRILEDKYPQCFIYGIKSNHSFFFGASPEKLCSINDLKLETEAIAGSAPRGNSFIEDETLETRLLSDPKEIREHFNVVKFIKEKLSSLVSDIKTGEVVSVKKLNNIQHLKTNITANLRNGINILDIIKALHPTPAVCGYPREEALKLINETEDFDRGLYSGIVGWYDENMNGEFVVTIRSALVKENKLYAFAGCGIVEGSNPASEFNETELKLKPILSLFENENTRK